MNREWVALAIGFALTAILTISLVVGDEDLFAASTLAAAAWVGGLFTYALVLVARRQKIL